MTDDTNTSSARDPGVVEPFRDEGAFGIYSAGRLRDYADANECTLTCSCGDCSQCAASHLTPHEALEIAKTIDTLRAQLEAAEADNDRLRSVLAEKVTDATLMKELRMTPGEIFAQYEGGAAHMLMECFVDQFKAGGSTNYLEMNFTSGSEQFAVTIQKVAGLTPAQKATAAEARAESAEAEVRAVWNAMPKTTRYLDPPDGGDVPLPEQIRRMWADVVRLSRLAHLDEAMEQAAQDLPDGWIVRVCAERGAGWVELIDPDADEAMIDADCDSLASEVHIAIDAARTKEAAP